MPPSAEANANVRGAGSPAASVQLAGKRKFTVSDGGISARVATTVEDGSAGRPARVLKPAARPPSPAPPRRARHAMTLVLTRLDCPRMSTHARCPQYRSSCFQTERNYGCAGTFLRPFPLFRVRVTATGQHRIPGVDGVPQGNKKARHSPGFSSSLLGRAAAYAASSSTTVSSSSASPSPSAGFGPRRGPLARAASISLIASVSVMRCTAEISRESRSSAAS